MVEEKERASVEDELQKSGFPLEIELSSFLEGRNWSVSSSVFYLDLDWGIPKEIDLMASKTLTSDSHGNKFDPYQLRLTLILQCKKSTKCRWVFYTRPRGDDILEFETGLAYTDFVDFFRTRSLLSYQFPSLAIRHELQYGPLRAILPPTVARSLKDTHQLGIAHPKNLRCLMVRTKSRSYEEIPKKDVPKDFKIYEVATNLLKATSDDVELSRRLMVMIAEILSRQQSVPREVKWPINLFLPVVVFDGGLWKWDKRADKIDEVLLQSILSSPNYAPPNYPWPYPFICIVNKERFLSLIVEIEQDLWKIADLVSINLESLNRQREIIEESAIR